VFVSVRAAIFPGMMDDAEADNFRRITLMSDVERANGLITQYRKGIDHYRNQLNRYYKVLGHIAERLGEPEGGDEDDL
jgi:hypothetical protein